jgi:hypothetical protein
MERVVDFLHESDQRTNVLIGDAGARIVTFQLFDQPPRIINADVKPIVRRPEKSPGERAQFASRFPGQNRKLPATATIDQAILQIDPHLRVGPFEKFLDLTEKSFVHNSSGGRESSSR